MSNGDKVRKRVLELYERHYGPIESEDQVLATDVNGFDKDPAGFYDDVCDAFPNADLEDILVSGGTVARLIAAIAPPKRRAKAKRKDWLDLYLADLRGRAERAKPTRDQRIHTVLNFVHRHGARGRRGLLEQVTAIRSDAAADLSTYVKQARARKLSFTASQMAKLLDDITTFAVQYPPPYPPLDG